MGQSELLRCLHCRKDLGMAENSKILMQLPHDWTPRGYQLPALDAWERGCRHFYLRWHRRAGKDWMEVNRKACGMARRPGLYWHVFPQYKQARRNIWNGMTNDGRRFRAAFPGFDRPGEAHSLVRNSNSQEMLIELINDSMYQLLGADQPDSFRGGNPRDVTWSEYAYMGKEPRDIVGPILKGNEGVEFIITTPNGKNHAYRLWDIVSQDVFDPVTNPNGWFTQTLTVEQTRNEQGRPIVCEEDMEKERREGKPEWWIQREYFCSFDVAVEGAFYGDLMMRCDHEKRIGSVPWVPGRLVHTAWDIGHRDFTAIWFFQEDGDTFRFIDYMQVSGEGMPYYAKAIKDKPYVYGVHLGPWDLAKSEMGTGKTIREVALSLGLRFRVCPKHGLYDGIDAVRGILGRCHFDKQKCAFGVQALTEYHRKVHEDLTGPDGLPVYSNEPVHDWSSHGADSFRYFAYGWQRMMSEDRKRNTTATYGNDFKFSFRG